MLDSFWIRLSCFIACFCAGDESVFIELDVAGTGWPIDWRARSMCSRRTTLILLRAFWGLLAWNQAEQQWTRVVQEKAYHEQSVERVTSAQSLHKSHRSLTEIWRWPAWIPLWLFNDWRAETSQICWTANMVRRRHPQHPPANRP